MLKNRILTYFSLLIFGCFLATSTPVVAQSEVINNVRSAIKAGSSKELSKYLSEMVSLKIEGVQSNYSKTQAEYVLKDFFGKYRPSDFQYVHQGASEGGLKYAIAMKVDRLE